MVAEPSSAESYLLDLVIHYHMEDAFRTGLDIVGEGEVVAQVPNLEVVSPSSEEVVLLVEDH